MTVLPPFPKVIQRNLLRGGQTFMVDAIGPLVMSNPAQPHVKLTLTPFRDGQVHLDAREVGHQPLVELHVADLMTVGTGSLTQGGRLLRLPKGLFEELRVCLDLTRQELVALRDFPEVFGPSGTFALRSTWSVVQHLKCLRLTGEGGETVLLPCLEAWRFTFGASSHFLQASVLEATESALRAARAASVLETADGRRLTLPLEGDSKQTQRDIKEGTLHLEVPPSFGESDLTTLAWLFTNEAAFRAMTRFYSSVAASRCGDARAQVTPFSSPTFTFPFGGTPRFRLYGLRHRGEGSELFVAFHVRQCKVRRTRPRLITHTLSSLPSVGDLPEGESPPEPRPRGRKPRLEDEGVEVDSLVAPDARLTTLHFGLRRDRFGDPHEPLVQSRKQAEPGGEVRLPGDDPDPERNISAGEKEPGGRGGRKVQIGEQRPFQPPPSRPVDHLRQFCDLQGVCEELARSGITARLISLNRGEGPDPTTAIPAEVGPAATWVGKGMASRRALVARLSRGERVAYALEWERIVDGEYGKLLLCSAGTADISHERLVALLTRCARERGVWPGKAEGIPFLRGISHRKPHRKQMSAQIVRHLEGIDWKFLPLPKDAKKATPEPEATGPPSEARS